MFFGFFVCFPGPIPMPILSYLSLCHEKLVCNGLMEHCPVLQFTVGGFCNVYIFFTRVLISHIVSFPFHLILMVGCFQ